MNARAGRRRHTPLARRASPTLGSRHPQWLWQRNVGGRNVGQPAAVLTCTRDGRLARDSTRGRTRRSARSRASVVPWRHVARPAAHRVRPAASPSSRAARVLPVPQCSRGCRYRDGGAPGGPRLREWDDDRAGAVPQGAGHPSGTERADADGLAGLSACVVEPRLCTIMPGAPGADTHGSRYAPTRPCCAERGRIAVSLITKYCHRRDHVVCAADPVIAWADFRIAVERTTARRGPQYPRKRGDQRAHRPANSRRCANLGAVLLIVAPIAAGSRSRHSLCLAGMGCAAGPPLGQRNRVVRQHQD